MSIAVRWVRLPFAGLLFLFLLFALLRFSPEPLPIQAQEIAQVTIETKTITAGEQTTIDVSIASIPAPGLADIQGKFKYDPAVLLVKDVTGLNGFDVLASDTTSTPGEARFVAIRADKPPFRAGKVLKFSVEAVGSAGTKSQLLMILDVLRDTSGRDISHQSNPGTFTITRGKPTADFSFSPDLPQVNQSVQFTDSSRPKGSLTRWEWDFGDGTKSEEQNPSHAYNKKGVFTVTLVVTDDVGQRSAATSKQIPVGVVKPTADFDFSPPDPRAGQRVVFTDKSTDDTKIVTWAWDFGDGSTGNIKNPVHIYARGGVFIVKLTVTDEDGASDTKSKEIMVEESPIPTVHNFPNPAVTRTTFSYGLPSGTESATLRVYDLRGRLVYEADLPVPPSPLPWDLTGFAGDLPNGPYFYVVVAAGPNGASRSAIGKLTIQRQGGT